MCLGQKKSLKSLRLKLMAHGMTQHTNDQSRVLYHSAIQAPLYIGVLFTSAIYNYKTRWSIARENGKNVLSFRHCR